MTRVCRAVTWQNRVVEVTSRGATVVAWCNCLSRGRCLLMCKRTAIATRRRANSDDGNFSRCFPFWNPSWRCGTSFSPIVTENPPPRVQAFERVRTRSTNIYPVLNAEPNLASASALFLNVQGSTKSLNRTFGPVPRPAKMSLNLN